MPAHNEPHIGSFVAEIDENLRGRVGSVRYVIVDDWSTVPVAVDVSLPPELARRVEVERNSENLGHGPSALRAYRAGVALGADVVLHVDGDGQFDGHDVAVVAMAAMEFGAAVGMRHSRSDPWFRSVLSRVARLVVGATDRVADVNSPLRAYQVAHLARLLQRVSDDSLVPHLHFARHHAALGIAPVIVAVRSRPRRGGDASGTMWGAPRRLAKFVPSRRLLVFAARALVEIRESARPVEVPESEQGALPREPGLRIAR